MRVKVSYILTHEEEFEMTPEEYCQFRADTKKKLPRDVDDVKIYLDEDGYRELREYHCKKYSL